MPNSRLSGEQFAAAMHHSPIATAVVALDGAWLWTGTTLCSLLGYAASDLERLSLPAITHPDDRGSDRDQIRQLLAGESSAYQVEKRCIRNDGSLVWCLLTVSLVRDGAGQPAYFVSHIQDVTQRRADDVERTALTERLALATHAGGVGVWEWDILTNTLIWDDRMFELYGYDRDAVMPCYDVFLAAIHPDHRDRVDHQLADAVAGRRAYDTEFPVVTASGNLRCLRAMSTVVRDDQGVALRMIGTNWDVTAANQLSAVQHEQNRFRAAVQAVQGVLWTNDATGRMVGEQPGWAALTGQSIADYQDYGWADAIHPDDSQPSIDAWNEAVAERRTFVFEHRVRRFDGAWRICAIRAVPLLDAAGELVEWVGVHTDITDQRQAEAEVRQINAELEARVDARTAELKEMAQQLDAARKVAEESSQAKSRFLTGMSHELRTPLNGILGYAQLLRLEGGLNATQSARVDAMLGAGKHLLGMITAVLDMSQIESGHVTLQVEPVDLAELAADCLDVVAALADEKRLSLHLLTGPDLPLSMTADPTRLRQVLLNLLGNAVKFTAAGGVELRLLRSAGGDGLRFEVADTGPGITPDLRARLFQDFERLNTRENAMVEGSGLGLAYSARLVALMGGRIGHDDHPGGGSLFWLELPLALAEVEPRRQAARTRARSTDHPVEQIRVLVTDDVAINREIAQAFLHNAGHHVTCASGGAEAVAAAAAGDYDIILMDVGMPEVDGLEATRRIRSLPGRRGSRPIIGVTAHAFADQIADCLAAGMNAHLPKPFTHEALSQIIARALSEPAPRPD